MSFHTSGRRAGTVLRQFERWGLDSARARNARVLGANTALLTNFVFIVTDSIRRFLPHESRGLKGSCSALHDTDATRPAFAAFGTVSVLQAAAGCSGM